MSTIKVDTIATRTGSGNITASNTIAGTSATLSGTLAVTGATTTAAITSTGRHDVNFNGSATQAFKYTDTGGGNLASFGQFYNPSNSLIGNIQNAANAGVHLNVGNGSVCFTQTGYVAANALDDYEEGTWVPVVKASASGSTYTYSTHYEFRLPGSHVSVNALPYTKIGNRVFIMFSIWWNTAATTRFNIDLPFAYDGSAYGLTGHATPYSISTDAGLGILGTTTGASTFDTFAVTSAGGHTAVPYTANSEVYYFICYQTA